MSKTISKEEVLEKLHELAYRKDLNVFKVLSNANHEIRHSAFLAWLLDPEENHGFGSAFAVEFLTAVLGDKNWGERFSEDNFNFKSDTYIATEKPVPPAAKGEKKGRIDIFIKGKDFTCAIENKTYSAEHDKQCQRYKNFIEEKYEDYDNDFIFLAIEKPPFFDEKDTDEGKNYDGYNFVSYETVANILNDLIDRAKPEIREFIEQYLVGVNAFYGTVSEKTKDLYNLYNSILKEEALAKTILKFEDDALKSKLRNAKIEFQSYTVHLQKNVNDEFIREWLKEIIKDEYHGIIDYHYGTKNKTDPYGYAIVFGGADKDKEDTYEKIFKYKDKYTKIKKYLNEIDYTAKLGIFKIAFFYNFENVDNGIFDYLHDKERRNAFCQRLKYRVKDNWRAFLRYEVRNGHGQGDRAKIAYFDLYFDKNKPEVIFDRLTTVLSRAEISLKRYEMNKIMNGHKVNENCAPLRMAKEMFRDTEAVFCDKEKISGEKVSETIKDIVLKYSEKYFETEGEKYNRLHFSWTLILDRKLFDKPILTDEDRDGIKGSIGKEMYDRTREGLELFELDNPIMGELFIPQD